MSALPPKADIAERDRHVRFVPIADIGSLLANRPVGSSRSRLQGVARRFGQSSYRYSGGMISSSPSPNGLYGTLGCVFSSSKNWKMTGPKYMPIQPLSAPLYRPGEVACPFVGAAPLNVMSYCSPGPHRRS